MGRAHMVSILNIKEGIMKELISKLVDEAGIEEKMAGKVIEVVKSFLEDKLPAPIASQVAKVLEGKDIGDAEGIMGKAKGLFGK